jgi:hypothetical protein
MKQGFNAGGVPARGTRTSGATRDERRSSFSGLAEVPALSIAFAFCGSFLPEQKTQILIRYETTISSYIRVRRPDRADDRLGDSVCVG